MINDWTAVLSVNAGLSLCTEDFCIWIDAIHNKQTHEFSTLSPEHQRYLFESGAFGNPDIICFTHTHPDHYSCELCERAHHMFPDALLVLPEQKHEEQILLHGNEVILTVKNRLLTFHRIIHEGKEYHEVPHYCLMIEDDGERILVLGDSAIAGQDLAAWAGNMQIDTVFAPFPWLTLKNGRDFISEIIKPSCFVVYHFPLKEEDTYGYIKAAEKAVPKIEDKFEIKLLTEAFQKIEL